MQHETYIVLRYDLLRICAFIAANSLLSNFLPDSARLAKWPRIRYAYEVLVDLVAGFALNWRTRLPSLNQEFIGFKRTAKHAIRNWQQARMDKATLAEIREKLDGTGVSVTDSGRLKVGDRRG